MAIYCSNSFLCPSNTIDTASTVSGKSRFRCEVMIWRASNALKCRSHSAEDAGITSSLLVQSDNYYRIRLFVLFPPIKWVKNISCSVNFGGSMAKVHRPVTRMTYCLLCPEHTPYSENLPFIRLRSIWSRVGARKHMLDGGS